MNVILDAGISDVEDAGAWLSLGVHKAVVGAETLRQWTALEQIPAAIDGNHLAFSLDIRGGKVLSQCPELAVLSPIEALRYLQSAGWQEIIILELSRVGSGEGVNHALLAEARAKFPGLRLLAGGGIASPSQLAELESLGITGVLVATALHSGIITAQHLSALDGTRK
jgi:phosphoribosylformimino-5-aminoimidazole carboxamide ribotide isomerase